MDTTQNRIRLSLPGTKSVVEVDAALGVFPRLIVDGERLRGRRGSWDVPLRNGEPGKLLLRGRIPGFQRFVWQEKEVLRLGAHVGKVERVALFSPLLLAVIPIIGVPIALLLFFMSVPLVKSPTVPKAMRIVLPFLNTFAVAFVVMFLLVASSGQQA